MGRVAGLQLVAELGWPLPSSPARLAWRRPGLGLLWCLKLAPLELWSLLYSWVANQVSAAVRLIPSDQPRASASAARAAPWRAGRRADGRLIRRSLWERGRWIGLAQARPTRSSTQGWSAAETPSFCRARLQTPESAVRKSAAAWTQGPAPTTRNPVKPLKDSSMSKLRVGVPGPRGLRQNSSASRLSATAGSGARKRAWQSPQVRLPLNDNLYTQEEPSSSPALGLHWEARADSGGENRARVMAPPHRIREDSSINSGAPRTTVAHAQEQAILRDADSLR